MTADLIYNDTPSPLQIDHFWGRLRIPGLSIHPSQCHPHPLPPAPSTTAPPSSSPTSSSSSLSLPLAPTPTPFFKPPPPSIDPDFLLATLELQAVPALTALFRLVLALERKGALESLGRGGFWERVADGKEWRPPSGRTMRAYEVVVLVMEIEFARTTYLRGGRGRDDEDVSQDGDEDEGSNGRTELESLVDEYTRVWEDWEARWSSPKGGR